MKTATRCAAALAALAYSIAGAAGPMHADGFDSAQANAYRIEVTLPDSILVGEACGFLEYAHVHGAEGGGVTIADCAEVTETPRVPAGQEPAPGLHNLQVSDEHGFLGCSLTFSARTMVGLDSYRNVLAFRCPSPEWKR